MYQPQAGPLLAEMDHIRYVLNDVRRAKDVGEVTEEQVATVVARYEQRYNSLYLQWLQLSQQPAPPPQARPAPPPGPPFSAKAFAEQNSILLLSYVGGFLLIVATLLFELYGTDQFSAPVRLGGIAALTAVFAGITRWCWGRERFSFIARTYLAVTALLVPLTMGAAYELLALQTAGLSQSAALCIGAIISAIFYGILALRLQLVAYAGLAVLGAFIAWESLLVAVGVGEWAGTWSAALLLPTVLARRAVKDRSTVKTFKMMGDPFQVLVGVWALYQCFFTGQATTYNGVSADVFSVGFYFLPATLLLISLAASLSYWLLRVRAHLVPCAVFLSLGVLALTRSIGADQQWFVEDLLVLGWLYSVAAKFLSGTDAKTVFRLGAVVQLVACLAIPLSNAGMEALAIGAAGAVALVVVWESRDWRFLLVATGFAVFDWYWLIKALVPPPPNPGPSTLALVYAPVPVILIATAFVQKFMKQGSWRVPQLAWAGGVAMFAIMLALADGSSLSSWLLIAYAPCLYAVGVFEDEGRVPLLAGPMAVLGILTVLPLGAISSWDPLIAAAAGAVLYLPDLGMPSQLKTWKTSHRLAGLGIMGVAALLCLGGTSGAVMSWLTGSVFSAFLFLDGYRYRNQTLMLLGPFALALSADWLAVYAGANDPQWFIDIPGVAAVAIALVARRRGLDPSTSDALLAFASLILLATTFLQSVGGLPGAWSVDFYTGWLLIESVGLLLLAIASRSPLLLAAGGAGVLAAALRALFGFLSQFPSYVTFAVVALILLGLGALLAAKRDEVLAVRNTATGMWNGWH